MLFDQRKEENTAARSIILQFYVFIDIFIYMYSYGFINGAQERGFKYI